MNYTCKIELISYTKSGKTNLIKCFINDPSFVDTTKTVGVNILYKNIQLSDGNEAKLIIRDTDGEKFFCLSKTYVRGSHGIIFVYDITNRESFQHVRCWINDLEAQNFDEIPIFLVGNKIDLEKNRKMSKIEAETFAKKHRLKFFECSSITGENVDFIFKELTQTIIEKRKLNLYNKFGKDHKKDADKDKEKKINENISVIEEKDCMHLKILSKYISF